MTIAALMLSGASSYDRARACVETWGRDFEILEVHSFTPCADLPLRIVGTREGPRSCFEKRLMGLEAVRKCETFEDVGPSADWFLCCSDDNYVWRENLEAALQDRQDRSLDAKRRLWGDELVRHCGPLLVGGHTNQLRIADGTVVTYPSGGAGYCLNRAALDLIANNAADLRAEWDRCSNNDDVEDAYIGRAAEMCGIPYLETPGFYGCNPLEKNCERHCVAIERPISFHWMTAEQMRELHQQRR